MNINGLTPSLASAPRALPQNGNSVAGPAAAAGPSPRVANFAQNMAADGAAVKGMGAGAEQKLFNGEQQPMMVAPTLTQSGFDMDRAFKLTSEKISAGRQDGSDIFAAALASVGEE